MQHIIDGEWEEIIKIWQMLGVPENDLFPLKNMQLSRNITHLDKVRCQSPVDSYKDICGYYGTVSINDFHKQPKDF